MKNNKPLFIIALLMNLSSTHAQIYRFTVIAGLSSTTGITDGTNTMIRFHSPDSLSADGGGNLYLVDRGNDTVRQLTEAGTNWISRTIVGKPAVAGMADGTNSAVRLNTPVGLALDTKGNIFITDAGNSTIRELEPSGTNWYSKTIAGTAGIFGSTNGTNGSIRFNQPWGLAVGHAGELYVADVNNNVIRELSHLGTNWVSSTIAGRPGVYGSTDGTNDTIMFNGVADVKIDSAGNLYLSDRTNSTIRKLTRVGSNWVSTTIAGQPGASGNADGINRTIRFNLPTGIAVSRYGEIYVTDTGNARIRKLTGSGTNWVSSTVLDSLGRTAGFSFPVAVDVDFEGNLYVADEGDNTIHMGVLLVPPEFAAVVQTTSTLTLSWATLLNRTYQVQYSDNLNFSNWSVLGTITASNVLTSASDIVGPDQQRFYRVMLLP